MEILNFEDYLDLACGTGNVAIEVCKFFKSTYAVDLSDDMLNIAFEKFKEHRIKAKVICQDMCELSLNRKFDLITSVLDSTNYITEDEDLKYSLKWLVPNSQKNDMEPIIITLQPGGQYKEEKPHEGEEFGYVLAGFIYLHLGDKKSKVRKGESFYFKPRANHYISNPGKKEAKVVWVSTPPSF